MSNYTFSFEKLEVWQESKELVKEIYKLTEDFPSKESFGITNQIRRAAISIPNNIVEGTSRSSSKEKARFVEISFGSAMEVLNLLIISNELDFLDEQLLKELRNKISSITNKLNALRNYHLKN